jgi:uncharacterized protein
MPPPAAPAASAAGEIPAPPLQVRAVDLTGTLNSGQLASLDSELRAFEQRKGSQIAVLMLPSTAPETIEQYSMRVAERWKIGRAKIDDGVILVIAKDDRRLRIEVGYGLEGAVPDAAAKRVIDEVIKPHFLANDFHGGIRAGTKALMKLIDGEKLPPPAQAQRSTLERWLSSLGWLAPFVYTFGFPLLVVLVLVTGRGLSGTLGRLPGSMASGVAAGYILWALMGEPVIAAVVGVIAFFLVLASEGPLQYTAGSGRSGFSSSGWSSGSSGGFSSSGSRSSGSSGGGSFGGGGASGSW